MEEVSIPGLDITLRTHVVDGDWVAFGAQGSHDEVPLDEGIGAAQWNGKRFVIHDFGQGVFYDPKYPDSFKKYLLPEQE